MTFLIKKMRTLTVGLAAVVTLSLAGTAAASGTTPIKHSSASSVASTPKCALSGLVIWLDTHEGGTAGSTYYFVEFTNLSGHSCTLSGYPGVTGINIAGQQLGSTGAPDSSAKAGVVLIANGARASGALRITDVDNFVPSACNKTMAGGLRVYLPGGTGFRVIPFPFEACSRTGPVYLHMLAVQHPNSLG